MCTIQLFRSAVSSISKETNTISSSAYLPASTLNTLSHGRAHLARRRRGDRKIAPGNISRAEIERGSRARVSPWGNQKFNQRRPRIKSPGRRLMSIRALARAQASPGERPCEKSPSPGNLFDFPVIVFCDDTMRLVRQILLLINATRSLVAAVCWR